MKKARIALLLLFLVLCICQTASAEEDPKAFSIGLYGGCTVLPMSVFGVDWQQYDDKREEIATNDDSYLQPAPLGGLAFTYLPARRFVSIGFTLEGFFQQFEGALKGSSGNNPEQKENYDFDIVMRFYQINFLGTIYFTRNAFKPYLQLGMGAVYNDAQIDSDHQTAYGASGIVSWGAQYSFTDWFAFGGQVRMQDMFGMRYIYEPSEKDLLSIEAQYIPLSLLVHTTFYF